MTAALIMALFPASATAAGHAAGLAATLAPPHASDRVIVKYEADASKTKRARSLGSVAVASARRASPSARNTVVVKLKPRQTVADAIAEIGSQPGVAYVEPDYVIESAATADDPYFTSGELWGMYGDQTTPANRFGSGAAEAWAKGFTGSSRVYVGIIDEGLKTTHEDLASNAWTNPWETVNDIDDDGNGYVDDINGWDFYNDDASVFDNGSDAHGTHVAGTVGARGGNGTGVAGVNWNVSLISAKFLGKAGGSVSDAIAAIDYVTDLKTRHDLNIVAVNASWSGSGYSQSLLDAINRGGDAGIVFVAAAGNNGVNIDATPMYPAAYRCNRRANGNLRGWDCIISVANIQADGTRRSDSNYGETHVDLGAPGTDIVSTVPSGYAAYSGTSMAAPHVAGAVALCASLDSSLTAKQLRARIFTSATPTSSLTGTTVTGDRLDVSAMAQKCAPSPPTTTTVYLDDLAAGFRRYGRGWKQGATGYAGHHFYTRVHGADRTAYGVWKPALPAAGTYSVQVRVPFKHATSRKAAYRIKTADGWVTRVRNQNKRRGSWVSLGKHRLTKAPIVQLANNTGEAGSTGRYLAYDAVRFIPIGLAATAEDR